MSDDCSFRFPVVAVLVLLLCLSSVELRATPIEVDLRPYGFSVGEATYDLKYDLFFLTANRLAIYFDKKLPHTPPPSHHFQLLVVSLDGQLLAQRVIQADPKAMDITAGPDGGLLFGHQVSWTFLTPAFSW